jgi:hypothetical protein
MASKRAAGKKAGNGNGANLCFEQDRAARHKTLVPTLLHGEILVRNTNKLMETTL